MPPLLLNYGGKTALHLASQKGIIDVIQELLKHENIKIDQQNEIDGKTALMYAAQKGHIKIVEILLANRANTE
ncbi:MAG TPA: hypothetical protein DEA62_03675 [Coxiellaceae bacterium]|nr:hypothetical protein [Coxiellaceae bacterium]